MLRASLVLAAALVVVAACSASGIAGGSGRDAPSMLSADDSDEPAMSGGASLPAAIIDPIVADAAARLGVDPSMVEVVAAEQRTYGDGSLDCPRPGMMYTQAVVDGYQVIVEASGTQLDYRGSAPGQFRICENP